MNVFIRRICAIFIVTYTLKYVILKLLTFSRKQKFTQTCLLKLKKNCVPNGVHQASNNIFTDIKLLIIGFQAATVLFPLLSKLVGSILFVILME
jgi:hypothetical protein